MAERITGARAAAAYVLARCRRFDAWSQQTMQAAREKFSLDGREAALCARLCLGVLQNATLCDYYIDCFSSVPAARLEPQVLDALRLGMVQLLFMDKVPVSAAVDQAVEQAKHSGSKAVPLVNAVLRRAAANKTSLPPIPDPGTARELSIRYSHPLWLCEKLVREHGYDFTREYLAENNRAPGLTVSVNLCRTDAVLYAERLNRAGIQAAVSTLSPVSVELSAPGHVAELPGYESGDFFVQDAAAAAAIVAADPRSGMRVLDVCAAPGGKSLLCASLMRGEGEIIACDLHAKKLSRIEDNAARLGFGIIRTAPMDAGTPPTPFLNNFDMVLADVPCSGMGVVRKKPEIRYKSREELSRLPEVQLRILRGAAACVRSGGELVYSTCTVFREENEAVTETFFRENSDFTQLESCTIWPQEYGTDGFYYCRMRKK